MSDTTINPGDGYRLLRPPSGDDPGELVIEGDELLVCGNQWLKSGNYGPENGLQNSICHYRRRIEQPEQQGWIPCDPTLPGHRLPTEADADDEKCVNITHAKFPLEVMAYWEEVMAYWEDVIKYPEDFLAWAPRPKSRPAEAYKPTAVEPPEPTDAEIAEAIRDLVGLMEIAIGGETILTVRELVDVWRQNGGGTSQK